MYPRRGGNSDRKRPSSNVMHNPDRSRAPLQPPPVILQFPLARIRFLSGCATRPRYVPRNVHVHAVIIIIIREIRNSCPFSSPVVRTERKKERKKRARGIGYVQSVLRFVIENGRRIDFSNNLIRDFDDFSGRNFFFLLFVVFEWRFEGYRN